jgi:hypothetical protein
MIKNAKFVVVKDAPHGMCTTLKDRINRELIDFIKKLKRGSSSWHSPVRRRADCALRPRLFVIPDGATLIGDPGHVGLFG